MASSYITSNSIEIFPSANRVNYPQSRLTSEQNLSGILTHIVSRDSFVITQNISINQDTDDILEFVVHGYYFKVGSVKAIINATAGGSSTVFSDEDTIYAKIKIVQMGSGQAIFRELSRLPSTEGTWLDGKIYGGNDDYFVGLEFTNNNSESGFYYLPILVKESATSCYIPEDSKLRFTTNSSNRTISIDDGDLDENE